MHADPSDPLLELLGRAAGNPAAPAAVRDLAARARRKAGQRARRRTAASAIVSAGVVLVAVLLLLSRFRGQGGQGQIAETPKPVVPIHPVTAPSEPDRIRTELASLNAEAAGYQRAADELRRMQAVVEQARRSADLLARPGALDRIEAARQRAALLLVREAEQESGGSEKKSAADESYRRAARLFPDTPAGRLAAGRLKTPRIPT